MYNSNENNNNNNNNNNNTSNRAGANPTAPRGVPQRGLPPAQRPHKECS